MKTRLPLLAISLFAVPAMAQLSDQAGFSGEISLNAGYSSTKSNFNTDGDKVINDVNQKASSDKDGLVFPLGSIAYTFGRQLDQQFYLGTSRDDLAVGDLALEIGYKNRLASGTVFDISYLPTLLPTETWKDPFLTGAERQKTDEEGHAIRLKLNNIRGSGFSLDLAYADREIDDEESGQTDLSLTPEERKLLERDSSTLYVKGQYRATLAPGFILTPAVTYSTTDADGDSNSNDMLGGELSLVRAFNRQTVVVTAGYNHRSFDEANPIYGEKRDENTLSLFVAYEYNDLMNWKNWSLVSFAGYSETDSDVTFYDKEQYIVSAGVNYKF